MELDMTKGSPFKLILKFMIPLIIGNVFQQFYTMVDTIIVGRTIGVQALAAVGATGTIVFLIIGFMQGATTGFTVLTSQRFGAGDLEGVRKTAGNAAVLSVLITIIMTIISVVFMDNLLTAMQTPADIYDMAKEYVVIICLGMCFTSMYNLLSSVLRALGNSVMPLVFLIISAVLNIVLDLVLIIVFHMGVAGAAVATIASQGVSGFLCLFYIMAKVDMLKLERKHWKLDQNCAKLQLSIGIPMALQFSITAVGTIMMQTALNILGSTIVAAFSTACKVQQLVVQPFVAMGMTMATYGGQNKGINDFARIRKGVRIAIGMVVFYGITIAIVIVSTFDQVMRLFVAKEEAVELAAYGNIYIRICAVFFIPLGLIFLYRNVLQGCGYSLLPMMGGVVELVSRCVIAFAAAYYRSYEGVCLADAMAWLTAGVFLLISYLYTARKWKKLEAPIPEEEAEAAG